MEILNIIFALFLLFVISYVILYVIRFYRNFKILMNIERRAKKTDSLYELRKLREELELVKHHNTIKHYRVVEEVILRKIYQLNKGII